MSEQARRLKKRRKELKLSQTALSELSGVPQTTISNYENESAQMTVNSIVALAHALEVSADWLLGIIDEPRPSVDYQDLEREEADVVRILREKSPYEREMIVRMIKSTAGSLK